MLNAVLKKYFQKKKKFLSDISTLIAFHFKPDWRDWKKKSFFLFLPKW